MKHASPITPAMIAEFKASYDADKSARILTAAACHNPLDKLALDPMAAARLEDTFSIEVKDPRHHRAEKERPLLAVCLDECDAGDRGGEMQPGQV